MSMTADMPEVVDQYIAAVNERRWDAIAPCFAEGAEFYLNGSRVATGPEAIADQLRGSMGSLPDGNDEIERVTSGSGVSWVEFAFRGRTSSGEEFEVHAADLFELTADGTRISRVAAWFDSASHPAAATTA